MSHEMTVSDFGDSVTGFDEIAITQRFGRTLSDMTTDYSMFGRALVFVAKRRDGLSDDDAWTAAMEMGFADVSTFFSEPPSVDGDGESGKASAEPEPQPESLLSSVS